MIPFATELGFNGPVYCFFEAFMRGRRARLCVVCHKVPSFLRSLIRGVLKLYFVWTKILILRGKVKVKFILEEATKAQRGVEV